jgi:hypothetical protein
MTRRKLILEKALADSLVEYCQKTLILPEDVLRVAMSEKPKEPFLLDARQLGGRNETDRMLRMLSALWKGDSGSFDKAAKGIGGHKRLWFSKDSSEIWGTGSSNSCQKIFDSPWWVSTNCPYNGMQARVSKVMRRMGFSWKYTNFVEWYIVDGCGRLNISDYFVKEPEA